MDKYTLLYPSLEYYSVMKHCASQKPLRNEGLILFLLRVLLEDSPFGVSVGVPWLKQTSLSILHGEAAHIHCLINMGWADLATTRDYSDRPSNSSAPTGRRNLISTIELPPTHRWHPPWRAPTEIN